MTSGCQQLCRDDGCQHERTADALLETELLMQKQPAGQRRKDRFQTHQQSRRSRGGLALTEDLQRIAAAAGKNARVEDRIPRRKDTLCLRGFKEQHTDGQEDARSEKLNAGHNRRIGMLFAEVIDGHDVQCEDECTDQHEQIAAAERKVLPDAEQIKSRNGARDAEPDRGGRLLPQGNRKDRHDHNIERGNEARFSGGRFLSFP